MDDLRQIPKIHPHYIEYAARHFVHFLTKFTIKNTSPPIESPMPVKKQIVLNGCPMVVVKPKPHNNQPTIIEAIDSTTLLFSSLYTFIK